MSLLRRWFKREQILNPDDLVKPYFERARQAILLDELPKAIAHLSRGIDLAPRNLKLYLQRAQIFQYGMGDYSMALRDYRFILRELENRPDQELCHQCKCAMKEMMPSA